MLDELTSGYLYGTQRFKMRIGYLAVYDFESPALKLTDKHAECGFRGIICA